MMRLSRTAHLAITPDGPRGPRRRIQPGSIYLAARTGLPIVPFGIALDRPWRMRSWDRFALPRPWSKAACVTGQPIQVPENLDKDGLEKYRLLVENQLNELTAAAEHLVKDARASSVQGARNGAENDGSRDMLPAA
jgi:hypothetical protein